MNNIKVGMWFLWSVSEGHQCSTSKSTLVKGNLIWWWCYLKDEIDITNLRLISTPRGIVIVVIGICCCGPQCWTVWQSDRQTHPPACPCRVLLLEGKTVHTLLCVKKIFSGLQLKFTTTTKNRHYCKQTCVHTLFTQIPISNSTNAHTHKHTRIQIHCMLFSEQLVLAETALSTLPHREESVMLPSNDLLEALTSPRLWNLMKTSKKELPTVIFFNDSTFYWQPEIT